ncbi:hypothetical protein EDC04DRAFT_2781864 [Pisolithus marmoratus]|nr:hypothetical protein EDC04DRAFT_2781864 [Pisolithus marmoratus]
MNTHAISPDTSLGIASSVLFMYDCALTFEKEIDLFWHQPRRSLLSRIPFFWEKFFSNSSGLYSPWCSGLLTSGHVVVVILQNIGSLVMILRVYAFYKQDRRVAGVLIVIASIATGMCCTAVLFRQSPPTSEQIAAVQGTHAGCPDPMTLVEYA